jgi:hypothetical protein
MSSPSSNQLAAENHIVQGSSALTPMELLSMREALLNTNSLANLELWVMIIVSAKLFLRSEELVTMKLDKSFIRELSHVSENGVVNGLAISIKGNYLDLDFLIVGKSDKMRKTLTLWADTDNPDLCPINALLAYLYLSKIKSGYVFANHQTLKSLQEDTLPDSCVTKELRMTYDTFYTSFKLLCISLFAKSRVGAKWGTHSLRKTAYLLGVWGGGCDMDLMAAARHVTMSNAELYRRSAKTLLEYARLNNAHMKESVWKPIYSHDNQLAASINLMGTRFSITN